MDEKLVVALVAAASAVGGVLVTQAFALIREYLISKREKNALLREKYELLADLVGESFLHRVKVSNHTGDEFFADFLNVPLERVFSLSILYFPELVEPSRRYRCAYRDFYLMLAENYIPDTGLSASMQNSSAENGDPDAVVDNLNETQKTLYECIQENASKYAKA